MNCHFSSSHQMSLLSLSPDLPRPIMHLFPASTSSDVPTQTSFLRRLCYTITWLPHLTSSSAPLIIAIIVLLLWASTNVILGHLSNLQSSWEDSVDDNFGNNTVHSAPYVTPWFGQIVFSNHVRKVKKKFFYVEDSLTPLRSSLSPILLPPTLSHSSNHCTHTDLLLPLFSFINCPFPHCLSCCNHPRSPLLHLPPQDLRPLGGAVSASVMPSSQSESASSWTVYRLHLKMYFHDQRSQLQHFDSMPATVAASAVIVTYVPEEKKKKVKQL